RRRRLEVQEGTLRPGAHHRARGAVRTGAHDHQEEDRGPGLGVPGAVAAGYSSPARVLPAKSFRLRKGTAPPPVNCGSVPFQRSIALFWMRSAVRDCCRSLFASACALALTSVACASPSASATFAFARVCWRCSSYSACWACCWAAIFCCICFSIASGRWLAPRFTLSTTKPILFI